MRHLIDAVLEGRGESSFHGFTLTADRGYGKYSLVQELFCKGISAIFVLPEHLIRCHPFVGRSFLSVARLDDEESESEASENLNTEEGNCRSNFVTNWDSVQSRCGRMDFDRPKNFIVEDGPEAGQAAFFATKTLRGQGSGRSKITAVAIRERGTEKFSKVIRFLYNLPSSFSDSLKNWVAVPQQSAFSQLFSGNELTVEVLHGLYRELRKAKVYWKFTLRSDA